MGWLKKVVLHVCDEGLISQANGFSNKILLLTGN